MFTMTRLCHFASFWMPILLLAMIQRSIAFHHLVTPPRSALFQVHNPPVYIKRPRRQSFLYAENEENENKNYGDFVDLQRRKVWQKAALQIASIVTAGTALVVLTRPAWADSRSRSEGYAVRKTEAEWRSSLSPIQYNILREGGTERPGFSILEKEKRPGTFKCAGCGTPLFVTADKFNSGTGWPSFARGLDGVEIEKVNPVLANLSGAELRCKTCGGHLGDVFQDGFLFQGTEAAVTGKRFCIDGAALVFYPDEGGVPVRGDKSANSKEPTLPSFLDPPKVTPREKE